MRVRSLCVSARSVPLRPAFLLHRHLNLSHCALAELSSSHAMKDLLFKPFKPESQGEFAVHS